MVIDTCVLGHLKTLLQNKYARIRGNVCGFLIYKSLHSCRMFPTSHANLFLQIPLGVLLVLSTQPAKLTQINPYSGNKIQQDFTIVGMKSTQILWFVESEAKS